MAWYFLDTSALAKRYIPSEAGSGRVRSLCRTKVANPIAIARITPVEIASTFGRLRRLGELDEREVAQAWRSFQRHYANHEYHVVQLGDQVYEGAASLLFRHPLRDYDAVQLACALEVRLAAGLTADLYFVTADANQAAAADREGLAVELIA